MKDVLILKNGNEIKLESGASLSDIRILSETKQDMLAAWDMLTEQNLDEVLIKNTDGIITGRYSGLLLEKETSIVQKDGTILTSFHLREKTEIERLEERIFAVENGLEVHTGAIGDLGEAVSDLAEGGLA